MKKFSIYFLQTFNITAIAKSDYTCRSRTKYAWTSKQLPDINHIQAFKFAVGKSAGFC